MIPLSLMSLTSTGLSTLSLRLSITNRYTFDNNVLMSFRSSVINTIKNSYKSASRKDYVHSPSRVFFRGQQTVHANSF